MYTSSASVITEADMAVAELGADRLVWGIDQYYRDPAVRSRLLEYCGGSETAPPSAVHFTLLRPGSGDDHQTWDRSARAPLSDLMCLLRTGSDLSRSLWDTHNLIFVFDLDYQNIDIQSEPFSHPAEVFFKLESVYRATRRALRHFGLPALAVMTGRGYHFTGRIPLDRALVDTLACLIPEAPAWYPTCEARRPPGVTATMSERQARAADGLGLLIEYLAHVVLRSASTKSSIPVVLNGTIVGSGAFGRECASLDFSHVGDPLDVRHVRMAFSTYQWHRIRPDIFGNQVALQVPPFVTLPRSRRPLHAMLRLRRSLGLSARVARRCRAALPDVTNGVERLLTEYSASSLARFHRRFYSEPTPLSTQLPTLDIPSLPPCLSASLMSPNDLLLKPEHLQFLTRGLLARGWTARQVATLVQLHYEQDHAWGDRWTYMHPRSRAEFDVRVFAGLIASGSDRMIDFNCVSAQEKGICPRVGCPHDLRLDRGLLLAHGVR